MTTRPEERLVVINKSARSVVESVRGLHPVFVFVRAQTEEGETRPLAKIYNTAWKSARERAAGVSFEDRQDLLGHLTGRITAHYLASAQNRLIMRALSD